MEEQEKDLYRYKVKSEGQMNSYSGNYDTLEEAIQWRETNGAWLSKQFNRKLILFKNDEII